MAKPKKPKTVTIYMDKTDWDYEVGCASDGNTIYPDLESLKEFNRCWDGCGVVKCEITFKEIAIEEDRKKMFEGSSNGYTAEDYEINRDIIRIESATRRLEWLEGKVAREKHRIIELKANLKKEK